MSSEQRPEDNEHLEEKTLLEDALRRMDAKMSQFNPWLLALSACCGALVAPTAVPDSFVKPFQAGCAVIIVLSAALVLVERLLKRPPLTLNLAFQLSVTAVQSFYTYSVLQSESIEIERFMAALALLGIGCGMAILAPANRGKLWIAVTVTHSTMAAAALTGSRFQALAYAMVAFMLLVGLLMKAAIIAYVTREARRDAEMRRLIRDGERRRIEMELSLARRIQDRLVPARRMTLGQSMNVASYQIKHSQVGGDWMAAKTFPRGPSVVVIADATGNGLQAALVIHAVQSLWADALSDLLFDAREWIARVNKMLYCMSESEPHTVSLGLLELKDDMVVYWSAGHPPAYARFHDESSGETAIHPLLAQGPLLGMAAQVSLTPKALKLPPDRAVDLLLGSDGVFERGTLTRREEVLTLLDQLAEDGESALSARPAADDKTLVWIRRGPLGKGLARRGA